MKITFEIDGTKYEQFDIEEAREIGAPSEVIGRTIRMPKRLKCGQWQALTASA